MKVTKRQLQRIIREERTKLTESESQVPWAIQDALDSLKYQMEEEINGRISLEDRGWHKDPNVVRAILIMLDNLKGEFEAYEHG